MKRHSMRNVPLSQRSVVAVLPLLVMCVCMATSVARAQGMKPYVQPDSTTAPKPPPITELTLVPLGARVAPEMDGVIAFLKERFPRLKIKQAALRSMPRGVISAEREQVIWEEMLPKLPEQPGVLYVVEDDLGSYDANFFYAIYDLPTGRGVVSASRFRSAAGRPTPPNISLDADALALSQTRFRSQILSAAAKLLGLSFPCTEGVCALRFPRLVMQVDLKGTSLCAKHQHEYEAIARERRLGKR